MPIRGAVGEGLASALPSDKMANHLLCAEDLGQQSGAGERDHPRPDWRDEDISQSIWNYFPHKVIPPTPTVDAETDRARMPTHNKAQQGTTKMPLVVAEVQTPIPQEGGIVQPKPTETDEEQRRLPKRFSTVGQDSYFTDCMYSRYCSM